MKKPMILNEILYRKHLIEQNDYLKIKLLNAKPYVKSNCPESFLFFQNKFYKNIRSKATFLFNKHYILCRWE